MNVFIEEAERYLREAEAWFAKAEARVQKGYTLKRMEDRADARQAVDRARRRLERLKQEAAG